MWLIQLVNFIIALLINRCLLLWHAFVKLLIIIVLIRDDRYNQLTATVFNF